jgi:hypothetical protein
MDFEALGYRPERIRDLQNLPELQQNNFYPEKKVKNDKPEKDKEGKLTRK